MGNEIYEGFMVGEIIKQRKSIRLFNESAIKIDSIYEMIDIAKYAPSGKNRQPWKIKVLNNEEKDDLIKMLKSRNENIVSSGSLYITIKAIDQCSKLLLVFNKYSYQEKDYTYNTNIMDTQSIGAFIQNILLLATERKMSTLWINDLFYAKENIEKNYSNNQYELVAGIAIGYSDKERKYNIRNSIDEIIF